MAQEPSFGNLSLESAIADGGDDSEKSSFRIAILGDFSARANRGELGSSDEIAERKSLKVEYDTLEETFEELELKLRLPIAAGNSFVELEFQEFDDFHPDAIYKTVDVFEDIDDLADSLKKGTASAKTKVMKWAKAAEELEFSKNSSGSVAIPKADALDDYSSLEASAAVADDAEELSSSKLMQLLVGSAVSKLVQEEPKPDAEKLAEIVSEVSGNLMREIMHHSDFQALESAWRGVYWLLKRIYKGSKLTSVTLLDISADELATDMASNEELDQTAVFKTLVSGIAEAADPLPLSAVIGLYHFDLCSTHAELLGRMSKIGARIKAPFLSGAVSTLMSAPTKLDDETASVWEQMRKLEESQFVSLTVPGFLARQPYGENSGRPEKFRGEEFSLAEGPAGCLWANGALAAGCLLAQSYFKEGWGFRPAAAIVNLADMPIFVYQDAEDETQSMATEAHVAAEVTRAIGGLGLMVLMPVRGRDEVQLGKFISPNIENCSLGGRWEQEDAGPPPDLGMGMPGGASTSMMGTKSSEIEKKYAPPPPPPKKDDDDDDFGFGDDDDDDFGMSDDSDDDLMSGMDDDDDDDLLSGMDDDDDDDLAALMADDDDDDSDSSDDDDDLLASLSEDDEEDDDDLAALLADDDDDDTDSDDDDLAALLADDDDEADTSDSDDDDDDELAALLADDDDDTDSDDDDLAALLADDDDEADTSDSDDDDLAALLADDDDDDSDDDLAALLADDDDDDLDIAAQLDDDMDDDSDEDEDASLLDDLDDDLDSEESDTMDDNELIDQDIDQSGDESVEPEVSALMADDDLEQDDDERAATPVDPAVLELLESSSNEDSLIEFKELLDPIDGDEPQGGSIPFDLREQLTEARKEIDPNSFAEDDPRRPDDVKKADWAGILSMCKDALTNTSKDLMLAARLAEALTKIEGFAGLRDSVRLMRLMVGICWDRLIPEIEDEDDLEVRAASFNWLDDPDRGALFPTTIRNAPIVIADQEEYSYANWKVLQDGGSVEMTQEMFDRAVLGTTRDQAQQIVNHIEEALDDLRHLSDDLDQKIGAEAPSFAMMRPAMEECLGLAKQILEKKGPAIDENESGGAMVTSEGAVAGGNPIAVQVASRDEAYRRLKEAANVLQTLEPHSPIPYLVNRAVELGALPFPLLMKALIRDSNVLEELGREFGIATESEEDEETY